MGRTLTQAPGARIGGYPILSKIGVGGQGTIYRGTDPQSGASVAIKVLAETLANDPVVRLRFAQECQVARQLNHPNIVRVLDFGLDGMKPYLVMEFVEGENLGQRLEREGRLQERDAVAIITQIGQALHWAHQRGLIHRDVKPEHILLTPDGTAKLTDLGLVKNVEGDFNLTCTLSALGTSNFTAPEQFEDAKHVDAQSDLFALAATLHMTLTGKVPFRARSAFAVAAIYKKKLANDIEPPRQLVPELSERVDAAVCQALRADRRERQATVLEFVESLSPPKPVEAPRRSRRPNQPRSRRPRFAVQINTSCQTSERDPKIWRGSAINISETGLCLELSRRFEPGTLMIIRIGGKKAGRRSLMVRVVWTKPLTSRTWQVGCQYDQPLTEEDVQDLC